MMAKIAGGLYLTIIICGIFGEVGVRMNLIIPGDAAATAANILAAPLLFKIGFAADTTMLLSDVAIAVLFYVLLMLFVVDRKWGPSYRVRMSPVAIKRS